MNPVMLDLDFLQIRWYSFFIFLAMISGSICVYLEAKKKNMKIDDLENMLFYGLILGLLGARIYYVLFNLNEYLQNPIDILKVWNGGLAIHGGIIAGAIFMFFYTKKKKWNLLLLFDIIVAGIILGQAIGRWGNFFNGEAYGREVTLQFLQSLHLPKFIIKGMLINGSYREPTFLYESICSFLGFFLLIGLRKIKKLKVGQLSGAYLIWYGIIRFLIESHRTDSLMLGPLRIAQLVSIVFIVVGTIFIIKNWNNKKTYHKEMIEK